MSTGSPEFDISRPVSVTSIATHIAEQSSKDKLTKKDIKKAKSCLRHFSVDGPFNYAFIYGSWEVVRARKVGTTRTAVDYVIYRLFYAIILVGLTLFEIVKENDLAIFFCSVEVWVIIVQIAYAFMFLQNVLAYNVHRENVKHRQKIPERLIVVDEIEKGGHKFYIYKRLSILPTDMLFNLEKVIYIMYNVVATSSITVFISVLGGIFKAPFFRCTYVGAMALAEVFLVPIPMKLTHFVFPVAFILVYALFIYLISFGSKTPLSFLDFTGNPRNSGIVLARCILNACILHGFLVGVGAFRDFVISLIDDSKTAKQQQSLRSQKRLARRRLMNFMEDEHGRMIGITLEKHSINDIRLHDEYIEKEGSVFGKRVKDDTDESSSSEDENKELVYAPVLTEIKPPPPARYPADDQLSGERFSSSSSDKNQMDDDLEALKGIILPSPPGSSSKVDAETEMERKPQKQSKIPLPLNKLGLHLKPRDSKEAIQEKLNIGALKKKNKGDDSPPTPPFVSLVQTMMKNYQQKKNKEQSVLFKDAENLADMFPDQYKRLIQVTEGRKEKERLLEQKKAEHLAKVQTQYNPRLSKSQIPSFKSNFDKTEIDKDKGRKKSEEGASGDKLLGSKVIFINKPGPLPRPIPEAIVEKNQPEEEKDTRFEDFHAELTKKLMLEKQRRSQEKEKMKYDARIAQVQAAARKKKRETKKVETKKIKSILIPDKEDQDGRSQKRQEKIVKRRLERTLLGKRGKSVYDPLVPPKIEHEASFHILGTKFKQNTSVTGENIIKTDMLPAYRQHPGIGTQTLLANVEESKSKEAPEGDKGEPSKAKPLVAFHPVVSYYDVNEVKPEKKRGKPKYKLYK